MTNASYDALRRAGAHLMGARAALDEARQEELREANETRQRSDVRCTAGGLPGDVAVNAHASNMLCVRSIAQTMQLISEAYEIIA